MDVAIQAAGRSSRFWPIADGHKSLLKIAGKTLLERAIESVSFADNIVVVEPKNKCISRRLNLPVEFRIQEEPLGTWNAFLIGAEGMEDFLYMSGYHFDKSMVSQISNQHSPAVVLREVSYPQDYGVALLEEGRLKQIIEKPKNPPSNLAVGSLYHLDSNFYGHLKKLSRTYSRFDLLPRALSSYFSKKPANFFVATEAQLPSLKYPWHALSMLKLLLKGIVVEKGAKVLGEVEAPAYIGKGAVVEEGSLVKGSSIEAGARVSGVFVNTLVGENSRATGHFENTVIGRDSDIDAFVKASRSPCVIKGKKFIPPFPFGAAFGIDVNYIGNPPACALIG